MTKRYNTPFENLKRNEETKMKQKCKDKKKGAFHKGPF